jgi:cell division septation protein DedD
VTRNGHAIWLVRTGGFADEAQAKAFCQQVRTAGGSCFVDAP